jgi:peptidoglycan/LPS O-acetylase OafA/YrhL
VEHKQYFGTVDLVRFAAALLVLLAHLGWSAWVHPLTWQAKLIGQFATESVAPMPQMWFGWIGVEIFFVISGLVIANSAAATSPIGYLKGRILRLYPGVWICATLSAAICLWLGARHNLAFHYVGSLVLFPSVHGWISGVYWTLRVEIVFYLLVFIWMLSKPQVSLLWLASILVTLSGLYLAAVSVGFHGFGKTIDEVLLLRHGTFFALGIALWFLAGRRLQVVALAIVALAIPSCLGEIRLSTLEQHAHVVTGGRDILIPILTWLAAVTLIFAGTTRFGSLQLAPKWLARTVRTIGLMTYPVYLFHLEVGSFTIRYAHDAGMGASTSLVAGIVVVLSTALCIVVWGEPPLRNWLRAELERLETKVLARCDSRDALRHTAPSISKPPTQS